MNLNNRATKQISDLIIEETYLEAFDNYNDCISIYIKPIVFAQVIDYPNIMGYKISDDSYTFNNLYYAGIVNFDFIFNKQENYERIIVILKRFKIAMDNVEFYAMSYEKELEETKDRFINALLTIYKTFLL